MKRMFIAIWLMLMVGSVSAEQLKLLNFTLTDNELTVGEDAVVMINPTTGYYSSNEVRIYLKANLKIDGVNDSEFSFNILDEASWSFLKSLTVVGEYKLRVTVYLEDKFASEQIYNDIDILENRIQELKEQIQAEQDPVIKEELIAQKNLRIIEKNQLRVILNDLRISIGNEELTFNVN